MAGTILLIYLKTSAQMEQFNEKNIYGHNFGLFFLHHVYRLPQYYDHKQNKPGYFQQIIGSEQSLWVKDNTTGVRNYYTSLSSTIAGYLYLIILLWSHANLV